MTHWRKHVVTLASGGLLATFALVAPSAVAGPAAFTSVDETVDGAGHCVHGNPAINCNAYDGKDFVWLNGGPLTALLGDGDYFFAVVKSGGQSNPNDTQATNDNLLSNDSYVERSFSISGGVFSYSGNHDADGAKVRLAPYDTTSHVYHLMICALNSDLTQPDKKSCKSDAFKVKEGEGGGGGFSAPTADKTADGTHSRSVSWTIDKSADQTVIHAGSPVATNYTVTADKTISNEKWGVNGTITVTNTNGDPLPVTDVTENLPTDEPTLDATCDVAPSGGGSYTFPTNVPAQSGVTPGTLDFDYSCSFANEPDYTETYLNTATVTYTDPDTGSQTVDAVMTFTVPEDATLDEGSDPECVMVSDTNASPVGSPGTGTEACDDAEFDYSITFFNNLCVDYPNTATIATEDEVQPEGWPRTADWTVTFCGPNAGGLTQGWWQNKNGQSLLTKNTASACSTLTGYTSGHDALTDLINADSGGSASKKFTNGDCADSTKFSYLPKFDLFVFGLAKSSGNGWAMLLSQWLTTTLDTASYPNTIKAGGPALTSGAKIYNPDGLLGLPTCTTIGALLTGAVNNFSTYKNTKSTVTALAGMFDRINNHAQPSCV
jgi:hypothetical protein